ncbi:hypothetical protein Taro_030012 [Colocasia esculenta]|uniref:HMA domain-containing protein n=1 Tax=Colocasia esculenta TaxID=4460 RepID=A0A843VYX3_COLES|nr:hypothetical protein [Colocasia esculenta]
MTNIVELCVHMDCSGCENKIKKALHRLKGVDEVEVDMAAQKVTVTGWADQKKVLKAVRKTGRRAVLWPYAYGAGGHPQHLQAPVQVAYNQHQPAVATQHYFHHPALGSGAAPSSSYNYYKHGYDNIHAGGGYYPYPREGATSMFSDDNPHACSIM